MNSKPYYVTTPIYYVNGEPHLGSAYTTTLADTLVRYHQFLGAETFFLTGTDEYGEKVAACAEAANKTPKEFTDGVSALFRKTWDTLGLNYSRFIRTTDEEHLRLVQTLITRIYEKGDIYFGSYEGLYCVGCERYLTEKELVDGKCPDHQVAPQVVREENYFFKMSKYQNQLLKHITETCPDFIRPERYKNEVLGLLREPLEDLCISRPKSRLSWGIEIPFDKNFVIYVWFDALINYLTGIDYPDGANFKKFWPGSEHLVGKDIIKPHCIYWPTMLMAADIPLPEHITAHGYWLTPTGKMSKSLGNAVDPIAVVKEYTMDVFRYYVMREMTFGLDGIFGQESLDIRYNADLANNLGNLVSRTLAMVHKYRDGKVPPVKTIEEMDKELSQNAANCCAEAVSLLNSREINRALERLWAFIDSVNIYVDRTKPWALAKEEKTSEAAAARLDTVLAYQLESLRFIAAMLSPFMPDTSKKILSFLGFEGEKLTQQQTFASASVWPQLASGTIVGKGETLFPRRDLKPVATPARVPAAEDRQATPTIEYDEFAKVQLRVGQIMAAEAVAKSEKLLKLQVDLGPAIGTRQILAGIAKHYKPEGLIGRKVAVVANLKPAKLMGLESQGMLLAASDEQGNLELLSIGAALPPGSTIR